MKLAALVLVVAALGLPINDLPLRAAGRRGRAHRYRRGDWRAAALARAAAGRRWLRAGAIQPAGAAHRGGPQRLPRGSVRAARSKPGCRRRSSSSCTRNSTRAYPPAQRCDPATDGCWRGQGFPDRTFAFSADGICDRPAYSRRVSGIDFADPVWVRLGFINELRYNWNSKVSDVERAPSRDRRASRCCIDGGWRCRGS